MNAKDEVLKRLRAKLEKGSTDRESIQKITIGRKGFRPKRSKKISLEVGTRLVYTDGEDSVDGTVVEISASPHGPDWYYIKWDDGCYRPWRLDEIAYEISIGFIHFYKKRRKLTDGKH